MTTCDLGMGVQSLSGTANKVIQKEIGRTSEDDCFLALKIRAGSSSIFYEKCTSKY
jgi:hypothetical protein